MLTVKNSSRYKKEMMEYKKLISRLQDNELKSKCEKIYSTINSNLNIIDQTHSSIGSIDIDPRFLRDKIRETVELRRQLAKFVKDSK